MYNMYLLNSSYVYDVPLQTTSIPLLFFIKKYKKITSTKNKRFRYYIKNIDELVLF